MNLMYKVTSSKIKLYIETLSRKIKVINDFEKRDVLLNEFKNKLNDDDFLCGLNYILENKALDLNVKLLSEEDELIFISLKKINAETKMITGNVSLSNSNLYKENEYVMLGLENITDMVVI